MEFGHGRIDLLSIEVVQEIEIRLKAMTCSELEGMAT